jgi:non-heme chloroperoxidase
MRRAARARTLSPRQVAGQRPPAKETDMHELDPGALPLRRRRLLAAGTAAAATLGLPLAAVAAPPTHGHERRVMSSFTTKDGTQIYFKDWGSGPIVSFSHGWPLSSDAWESQMFHLASNGFRCIAHDRRGHGRSSQPWGGNDMDTYADDLNELFTHLDAKGVTMVGHSTGGGEVARYIGRHGTKRVARAVLMGAVTPVMVKSPNNPKGLPMEVFDGFRKAYLADRAQFFLDIASGPFFNFNRPGAKVSQGMIQSWLAQGLMTGHKNAYDCIKAFSETDFTEDLKKFDVPTLIAHGDDDQIVPIAGSAMLAAKLVRNAQLKIYPGGSHSLGDTERDKFNADLLAFARSGAR